MIVCLQKGHGPYNDFGGLWENKEGQIPAKKKRPRIHKNISMRLWPLRS